MWEDGSLPFSEQSQRRFNDWMDSSGFGCDISCCDHEDRVILGPWILNSMIHYEDLSYNPLSDHGDDSEDDERDEDEGKYDEEDDGSDADEDEDEDEEIDEENPN